MSKMIRLRARGRATLMASVLVLGAALSGAPAHAQMSNNAPLTFNNGPLIRPPSPVPGAPLTPGQQLQFQSYGNALTNQQRADQNLFGPAGANAALQNDRRLNSLQLQQLQQR
jgi:hypothetical protein